MAVATYEDVSVALGRPISDTDQQAQVEHWLTGIELVITQRLGDVSLLDQAALLFVESEAVASMVRQSGTPESSITVSVDDGSVTRRFDGDSADYTDFITTVWWGMLGRVRPRATSMTVGGGYMLQ